LENQEKVIEYLQKSAESCDCPVLPSIMRDAQFDDMRSNPRFMENEHKINILEN